MNAWIHFYDGLTALLGLGIEPRQLTFSQVSLRGLIVFVWTITLVRISARRSLARRTVFDSIFLIILASLLARAINGSADLFPTLGAGVVLVIFHRLLATVAYYSHWFADLIKGPEQVLFQDGEANQSLLRRNHITQADMKEDLRLALHRDDLDRIAIARFERSGGVSFIPKD